MLAIQLVAVEQVMPKRGLSAAEFRSTVPKSADRHSGKTDNKHQQHGDGEILRRRKWIPICIIVPSTPMPAAITRSPALALVYVPSGQQDRLR